MNRSSIGRLKNLEFSVFRPVDLLAIRPPKIIHPAMNGERPHTDEDVALTDEWMKNVSAALKRETVTVQEVLDALPMPFRSQVIADLKNKMANTDN